VKRLNDRVQKPIPSALKARGCTLGRPNNLRARSFVNVIARDRCESTRFRAKPLISSLIFKGVLCSGLDQFLQDEMGPIMLSSSSQWEIACLGPSEGSSC